jgi:hypothetical protein
MKKIPFLSWRAVVVGLKGSVISIVLAIAYAIALAIGATAQSTGIMLIAFLAIMAVSIFGWGYLANKFWGWS